MGRNSRQYLTNISELIFGKHKFQISLMVPPDNVPGRLGLLVTLSLCMINTLNSVASSTPRADNATTALVKWILLCMVWIQIQMVTYAWILFSKYNNKKVKSQSQGLQLDGKMHPLDKQMLLLSPIGFFSFTIIFWACRGNLPILF